MAGGVRTRSRRPRSLVTVVVAAALSALGLVACTGGHDGPPPSGSSSVSPVVSPASSTPVPPPSPPPSSPPTRGPEGPGCIEGWITPRDGSPRYLEPLGIIRRTTGARGPLIVTDMRYFEGPESPPSDQGYLLVVQRWYVRLYAHDDPAFQGRFLIEARRFGRGISAVAPYDTHGFRSPDWVGFQFDSADTTPEAYAGLPGAWEGTPYDFVKGGDGLDLPGLPAEVVGCLEGT